MSTALLVRNHAKFKGEDGAPGKNGTRGLPGKAGDPGLTWRGSFKFGETYQPGDVVESDGSTYVATVTTARKPPDPDWDLLAAKGADGASGRGYIRGGGGSGSAGSALAVKDEGVALDAAVTSLDFAGAGVTATAVGHAITVTVPGGLPAGGVAGQALVKQSGVDGDADWALEIHGAPGAGGDGGEVSAEDASSDTGGAAYLTGGFSAGGQEGAEIIAGGGDDDSDRGGFLRARGGFGISGSAGGRALFRGGTGDAGNDIGAEMEAQGGSGSGTHGKLRLLTNNSTGGAGDLLTAQGDDSALWVPPAFDAAGAAAAAQAASQPVDATLTALAAANWAANAVPIGSGADALSQVAFAGNTFPARASTGNLVAKTITDFGLSLIDDAAASNARTTLGLGTAAVAATGDFDPAGTGAAAAAASIAKTFLDAKGDLISASADNTPSLLTVGANDTILMADSVAAAGLKWVASQTPTTQAFSDAAAQGSADTYARGDHLHGMPAAGGLTDHTHAATGTGANGGGATLNPVGLQIPTAAGISLTATEGYVGDDSTTKLIQGYDSQRQRAVASVGWVPYAFPPGYAANASITTTTTLAAAGGSIACPIPVPGHMLLQALQYRSGDTGSLRTAEWQLYLQYLNNANAGENTLAAVTGATGTDSFTPGAASTRTSAVTSPPIYLGPGLYWLVFRNTHATNSFAIQGAAIGTMQNDLMQTKTLGSALGSTLDFVAATWTKVGSTPLALILQGRVFGQTAAF